MNGPSRLLAWSNCYNARDLGGYRTDDGGQTRWGSIVRADSLCQLTPSGCAALRAYGIRTVIDLRHRRELDKAPHPFAGPTFTDDAPNYLHLPLEEWDDPDYDAAMRAAMPTEAFIYPVIMEFFADRLAAVLGAIAHAPDGGVVVHCTAGKDRTGIVAAALLAIAGVSTETIVADYALSAALLLPRYEEAVRQAQSEEDRARLPMPPTSPPGRMVATLDWVEQRYGGMHAYLAAAGVSAKDIARLRARLR